MNIQNYLYKKIFFLTYIMDRIKIEKLDYSSYYLKNYGYCCVSIRVEYDGKKIQIGEEINKFSSINETKSKLLRAVLLYEVVREKLQELYSNLFKYSYSGSAMDYYEERKKKYDEQIIEKANEILKQFIIEKYSDILN